jgi:hypothetical protein
MPESLFRSSPLSTHEDDRPTFAHQREGSLDGEDCASQFDAEDEVEGLS